MAERKNLDYTNSAINLLNPLEVRIDLEAFAGLTQKIAEVQAKIDAAIPQDLKDLLASYQTQLAGCTQALKANVEQYGSYQDVAAGWYAVKQRRTSVVYNVEAMEKRYPQFAPAVITKVVDPKKIEGLIKGGLLAETDLVKFGEGGVLPVMERVEISPAFIIKVAAQETAKAEGGVNHAN